MFHSAQFLSQVVRVEGLDEFSVVLAIEAVPTERGPTIVRIRHGPPPEQGQVAPVPAHVDLVLGEPQ